MRSTLPVGTSTTGSMAMYTVGEVELKKEKKIGWCLATHMKLLKNGNPAIFGGLSALLLR